VLKIVKIKLYFSYYFKCKIIIFLNHYYYYLKQYYYLKYAV